MGPRRRIRSFATCLSTAQGRVFSPATRPLLQRFNTPRVAGVPLHIIVVRPGA